MNGVFSMSEEKKTDNLEIINEDIMMERGKFVANGYTFTISPVYLMEEDEYFGDLQLSPVPASAQDGEELTDKELGQWAMALFSTKVNNDGKPYKKIGNLRRFWIWLFHRNDYHYYECAKNIVPYIKWIEKKVKYNGKRVRFYDLERKFELSKSEIESMFIYLHKLSGF